AAATALLAEMRADAYDSAALAAGVNALNQATQWIVENGKDRARVFVSAAPYLELMGIVTGGWLLTREAKAAARRLEGGHGDAAFNRARLATAKFYDAHILAAAPSFLSAIESSDAVLDFALDSY
ncbi:MAG: acyl-CoA dehydrogenase C-terminal domain-containing protein, partial [Stellaceae bacterium]